MFTGDQLKQKRKSAGLSAEALAKLLSVKKDNIYKWEKGTRPTDPEDFLKVSNWVAGKIEIVPHGTERKPTEATLMERILEKQNSLIEVQNLLLSELKEGLQEKINRIDKNSSRALGAVEKMRLQYESASAVALESLSRLEKKAENYLSEEVGNRILHHFEEQQKQSRLPGRRK